ncbi:unnamed protein product [Effrenium voratum]|uniref:Uncharacterized protein n=1 Tax=Effrenium voratum TaxID=2562239 RepID=A0AA36JT99_9DINO|nr:unnamed protein product [Effrenium voratum]
MGPTSSPQSNKRMPAIRSLHSFTMAKVLSTTSRCSQRTAVRRQRWLQRAQPRRPRLAHRPQLLLSLRPRLGAAWHPCCERARLRRRCLPPHLRRSISGRLDRSGSAVSPGIRKELGMRPSGFQAPKRFGVPGGLQTPETVPVGILSNMLANAAKDPVMKHVRYRPLDPALTPQVLPEVPTAQLLGRVEEFYEDLREEDSSSSSSSRSRSRERAKGREAVRGFGAMSAVPPPIC